MIKNLVKRLTGLVRFVWNWIGDLINPELNEDFFEKIDRDYFPK